MVTLTSCQEFILDNLINEVSKEWKTSVFEEVVKSVGNDKQCFVEEKYPGFV